MYPIQATAGFTAHRHATAASSPSDHSPFWGRPVDSYEGHAAWRPAVFTCRAAAFLRAEQDDRAFGSPVYRDTATGLSVGIRD